ncbi:hypothetical protein E2C01_063621 [Portunus trituberculatus]|uniref:Uncharacterized protein n=1 Tax=Portunus trituberculatus TaxID=210409 RepID=A0A5B7HKZ7_PORTR|nr:hypothetical protein [Portunus trituberculatus]
MPFVEWFKVIYMSTRYPGSRWLHQRCAWVMTTTNGVACATNGAEAEQRFPHILFKCAYRRYRP